MMGVNKEKLLSVLWKTFRLKKFRPLQLEAIQALLDGEDVMIVLPTGGGKSLIYQLPPLTIEHAFIVVISPLISLAQDQVLSCGDKGIYAELWTNETTPLEKTQIEEELLDPSLSLKLLYTTPESLIKGKLQSALKAAVSNGTLMSFAVDEAHCISSWGHDFRPSYRQLGILRGTFPSIPFVALTATCTEETENSILEELRFHKPKILKTSFNRPNIKYLVKYKDLMEGISDDHVLMDLTTFVEQQSNSHGIIYARLRKTCEWLSDKLGDRGVDVSYYHAGMTSESRKRILETWLEGGIEVIVATIAFGMGIDKANVRWVVHWNAPSSLEGLYQESGRAGRDGLPCQSVVYVSQTDLRSIKQLEKGVRRGAIHKVAELLLEAKCRRKALLSYFGESHATCSVEEGEEKCDVCTDFDSVQSVVNALSMKVSFEFLPRKRQYSKQERRNKRRVVECYKEWCGPCKAIVSAFRRLCMDLGDSPIKFYTANVDRLEALQDYRENCKPRFLFYKDGKMLENVDGVNYPELLKHIMNLSKC